MFSQTSASYQIAEHCAATTFANLPPDTVHATRRALLDAAGVMLAATGLGEDCGPYRAYAAAQAGPCRMLGSDARVLISAAALANGSLAHALDFGDTFDAGPAHPNAALVPALLALADADRTISLGDFLTALTVGSDLACRLSLAASRPYEAGGWYPPPLVNLIAGAAACAKLLGLPAAGIADAMGLALLQGAYPAAIKLDGSSPVRGIREAFVAKASVEAALMAQAGAKAFQQPLEGPGAFFAVYTGGPPTAALLEGLGSQWLGDQVSFKPWPACRGTHAYIEAALALRGAVDLHRIERIEAETGPIQSMLIRPQPDKAHPSSAIEARFSIPFTVAQALVAGTVDLDSFHPECRTDPHVLGIAERVVERLNADWSRQHASSGSLAIVLTDGTRIEHAVPQALGHPSRPISDETLADKFRSNAARAARSIDSEAAEHMANHVLHGSITDPAATLLTPR